MVSKTISKLNNFLAELNVFYRKLQNYHWYIKGKDFFQVHTKLEEYYDQINEQIDEVAELILQLGGSPLGTMKDYLNIAKIEEAENVKVNSSYVLEKVLADYKYLLNAAKDIKKSADEEDDYLTSAFIDGPIGEFYKNIWMLSQTTE